MGTAPPVMYLVSNKPLACRVVGWCRRHMPTLWRYARRINIICDWLMKPTAEGSFYWLGCVCYLQLVFDSYMGNYPLTLSEYSYLRFQLIRKLDLSFNCERLNQSYWKQNLKTYVNGLTKIIHFSLKLKPNQFTTNLRSLIFLVL